MFFKRVIFALFGFFITIMLFIFIIRVSRGLNGFLGFSDLIDYFDSGKIDFYKPINTFIQNITKTFNGFASIIEKAKDINNFFDVLSLVATLLVQAFKLMAFPVILIFEFIRLIISYFSIFIDFINWIISFEGWKPIS